MGLKDLRLKLKAFRLRRFLIRNGGKRRESNGKKPPWMTPISHGYHVVEDQSYKEGSDDSDYDPDSVVVQREQIQELEILFFGLFNARIGDGVTKYLQSHLFDRNPQESQIGRKSKDTMRKTYLGVRAKIKETERSDDEKWRGVSASVMVINGEKLVIANMGYYKAVVCRDGVAYQLSNKHHHTTKRHWSPWLFSVRKFIWNSQRPTATKQPKSLELIVGAERIDADTEFVIMASSGIWEVMKNQEAVNLIRHLQDPQQAAECLANEASSRMTKSNISCVVIRFD